MEIGSFIELQLPEGKEYFDSLVPAGNIAKLNSGRAGIWHAFRLTGCRAIWLPYYQCETVRDFLKFKNVTIKYYHIDREFKPIDIKQSEDEAVLLVNYYGIMANSRMESLAGMYSHVIIDNSQAFFAQPLQDCFNVYSARKFMGVPDGAYVIGKNAIRYVEEYQQGFSSDTSLFLLQRIEYGCEGKTYSSRMANEERIDHEDAMKMSALTKRILQGTNYQYIIRKRKENFKKACEIFAAINKIQIMNLTDEKVVPMAYPLVVESDSLLTNLLEHKHYQGHWWHYITRELPKGTFEHYISQYMIPITIDQRYGIDDIHMLLKLINDYISKY